MPLHWGGGGELPRWQGFGGGGAIHWLCGILKENLRHARTSPLPCCLQEIEAQDVVSLVVGAMLRAGEARQRCVTRCPRGDSPPTADPIWALWVFAGVRRGVRLLPAD